MESQYIVVKGAKEHNLKNISVNIPRNKLVVVTGVSGSGKSSLAFDTIYAEGQRRYVESLSAYARQFLGLMDKPDVEYIEGLSPAISIDQKGVSHNPRSTVGTVTEVYDYIRLLYARIGKPHCYKCGREVKQQTVQQIVDAVLALPQGTRIVILAPQINHRKGEHKDVFESSRKAGYVRVRVNGEIRDLSEDIVLDRQQWHTIEVVVDRVIVENEPDLSRISDSLENALRLGDGIVQVSVLDGEEYLFSEHLACVHCGESIGELEPRTFSFNSPHGACPKCTGLGYRLEIDPDLIVRDREKSLVDGVITPWSSGLGSRSRRTNLWHIRMIEALSEQYGFAKDIPIKDLGERHLNLVLYGDAQTKVEMNYKTRMGRTLKWRSTFEGVIPNLERRYRETESDYVRREIEKYMAAITCKQCKGRRLKPQSLAVEVSGKDINEITSMTIKQAILWINSLYEESFNSVSSSANKSLVLTERERSIATQIVREIDARLRFLNNVGLDYLTLNRTASTLSGGESQRIRLATQIGSGLTGVLYVCDEPSIGLHPVDDRLLIETLKNLRDIGNSVVIVEHDEAIMRAADHIIDMGPGAGANGGEVVAQGTLDDICNDKNSLTGLYLSGRKKIGVPTKRRSGSGLSVMIKGARENNLRNVDVCIPLGKLVCITGVSGSGKSTLIYQVLYKKLAQILLQSREKPGLCDGIEGVENIDKIVNIDQSPIGRTPRSNPATYTGVFTFIRELFATVPEARARGYNPGRFSFNVKGGRCEACSGGGYIHIEMQFLPDVTVPCEICQGKRYNREALEITFKGINIAQALDLTVSEALDFFENFPKIKNKLETMKDVGLGYIKLGQPATTLSGGEAQRVKLSTELSRKATGKTLYILDEPTTGLSFEDCSHLLGVLHRLVDSGNTVVLIEHHLDLIKNADWIIDLGPGAGDSGGRVVATGTPENIVKTKKSKTGPYIKNLLK
mgnify:FL=1|tara:strand:+ start:26921 stop:29812 length:2892 start_codon:yes stop_codon:yes gene_type:complete